MCRKLGFNFSPKLTYYILGAGKIGARFYNILLANNIPESNIIIWDTHPDRVKGFENKSKIIPTPSPTELNAFDLSSCILYITVYAHDVSADLYLRFKDSGFQDIVYKRSFFSSLFIKECAEMESVHADPYDLFTCFTCPSRRHAEFASCSIFDSRYGPSKGEFSSNPIVFDTVGLLVTTSCNLTCIGCNHLRDKFEPAHNVTYNAVDLVTSLRNLSQSVDFIRSLVIVGGESFLHKELAYIISECKTISNIGYIQIITNGGILPIDPFVFEELKDPRVIVEISGYGSNISLKNQAKRDELIEILKKQQIMFRYDEATSWIDFGGFEFRDYSPSEVELIYRNCCFVSNDILDGRLYKCSRSAYGRHTNLISSSDTDSLDLKELPLLPINVRRQRVQDFIDMIPSTCQYCDGTNPKLIPAGIQASVHSKN